MLADQLARIEVYVGGKVEVVDKQHGLSLVCFTNPGSGLWYNILDENGVCRSGGPWKIARRRFQSEVARVTGRFDTVKNFLQLVGNAGWNLTFAEFLKRTGFQGSYADEKWNDFVKLQAACRSFGPETLGKILGL